MSPKARWQNPTPSVARPVITMRGIGDHDPVERVITMRWNE
jgi:hypothetical protein